MGGFVRVSSRVFVRPEEVSAVENLDGAVGPVVHLKSGLKVQSELGALAVMHIVERPVVIPIPVEGMVYERALENQRAGETFAEEAGHRDWALRQR